MCVQRLRESLRNVLQWPFSRITSITGITSTCLQARFELDVVTVAKSCMLFQVKFTRVLPDPPRLTVCSIRERQIRAASCAATTSSLSWCAFA